MQTGIRLLQVLDCGINIAFPQRFLAPGQIERRILRFDLTVHNLDAGRREIVAPPRFPEHPEVALNHAIDVRRHAILAEAAASQNISPIADAAAEPRDAQPQVDVLAIAQRFVEHPRTDDGFPAAESGTVENSALAPYQPMKSYVAFRGRELHDAAAAAGRIAKELRIAIMDIQTGIRLHDPRLETQKLRLPLVVLVQKRDELGARTADAGVARACPPAVFLHDVLYAAAIRMEDAFQIFGIGRAVIDYDDFIAAESLGQN